MTNRHTESTPTFPQTLPRPSVARLAVVLLLAVLCAGWPVFAGDLFRGKAEEPSRTGEVSAPRRTDVPLGVDVQIGLGADEQVARFGSWTPITVTVESEAVPLRGVVRVWMDTVEPTHHLAPLELPANARKVYRFLVRVPLQLPMPLRVEVSDMSGRVVYRGSPSQMATQIRMPGMENSDDTLELDEVYDPLQQVALVMISEDKWSDNSLGAAAGRSPFDSVNAPGSPFAPYYRHRTAFSDDYTAELLYRVDQRADVPMEFLPGGSTGPAAEEAESTKRPKSSAMATRVWSRDGTLPNMLSLLRQGQDEVIRRIGREMNGLLLMSPAERAERRVELVEQETRERALLNRFHALWGQEMRRINEERGDSWRQTVAPSAGLLQHRPLPGGLVFEAFEAMVIKTTTPHEPDIESGIRYGSSTLLDYFIAGRPVSMTAGRYGRDLGFRENYARRADNPAFVRGEVALLPDDPQGYDGIDVVIWEDLDPGTMTEAQHSAMMTWLQAGGRVILAGGTHANWMSSAFADLSPAFLEEPTLFRFPFDNPIEEAWSELAGQLISVRDMNMRTGARHIAASRGRVLVAERPIGGGSVTTAAFSLAELGRICQSQPVPLSVMGMFFPLAASSARFDLHSRNASQMMAAATGAGNPFFTPDGIFFAAFGFILIGIGLSMLVAWRLRRPLVFWFGLIGATILFCLLSIMWVSAGREEPVLLRHVGWVEAEVNAPVARVTSFLSYQAQMPRQVVPALTEGRSVILPFQNSQWSDDRTVRGLRQRGQNDESVLLRPLQVIWRGGETSAPTIAGRGLMLGHHYSFAATSMQRLGGSVGAEVRTEVDDDGTTRRFLTIRNETAHTLRDVRLYEDPIYTYDVPDLEPGESIDVEVSRPVERQYVPAFGSDSVTLLHGREFGLPEDFRLRDPDEEVPPAEYRLEEFLPADTQRLLSSLTEETSVVRALLGIADENVDVIEGNTQIRQYVTSRTNMPQFRAVRDVSAFRESLYLLPSRRPDAAFRLVARVEEPVVEFELGESRAETKVMDLQILSVRIPFDTIQPRWAAGPTGGPIATNAAPASDIPREEPVYIPRTTFGAPSSDPSRRIGADGLIRRGTSNRPENTIGEFGPPSSN